MLNITNSFFPNGKYKNKYKYQNYFNDIGSYVDSILSSNLTDFDTSYINSSYKISHENSYAVITFPLAGYNKEEIEVTREESKIIVKRNPQKEIFNVFSKLNKDIFDIEKVKKLAKFQDKEVSTVIELPEGFENSKYSIKFVDGLLLIVLKAVEEKKFQTMKIQ